MISILHLIFLLRKKEFDLPSLEDKDKLEKQIDDSQQDMRDSQERLTGLQSDLRQILDRMAGQYDPADLQKLRDDAHEKTEALDQEQQVLEDARSSMDQAEKELRAKAKLFVWIDRPDSRTDWIALVVFIFAFLACAALQLKHRDHTFKLL